MNAKLWTRNFSLAILASGLGAAGAIAGGFALSFLVFDETGSTLASALVIAVQLAPYVLVPLLVAPLMDRLPRKRFLVLGDCCNGLAYFCLGLWLLRFDFSYTGYLAISVLLACLGSVDQLAYTSIYPELIPKGQEEKGYAVGSMLYPILTVIMTPLSALLLDTVGVPLLLMGQGVCSLCASLTESFIRLDETSRLASGSYTLTEWKADLKEALTYLRQEKGLQSLYGYMSVANGIARGYSTLLVAFFRTVPGFSAAMYSVFSVAEFLGRTAGSALQYRIKVPPKKKFGFVFFVYQTYDFMDACLLWLPYPLMLVNRGICGFLGSNSAILREAAVQRYIPSHLRSRVNAFNETVMMAVGSVLALAVGALGEVLDYRVCVTLCGFAAMCTSLLLIWGRRKHVRKLYEQE